MSDEDTEQNQTGDEREGSKEREEREHRRHSKQSDSGAEDTAEADDTFASTDSPDEDRELSQGMSEERLDIPQITVKLPVRLDATEPLGQLPSGENSVQIPQVETRHKQRITPDEVTATILTDSKSGLLGVPQFSTASTDRLKSVEFADEQLAGIERLETVQIPQVTLGTRDSIRPFSSFVETVPGITAENTESTAGSTETVEEAPEVSETNQIIQRGTGPTEGGSRTGWSEGDWPDPLELLLGAGGTDIKSRNPLVVNVGGDDSVGVVETLVKRRYREIEGGEPELKKFDTADQLANEERWLSADSQIFTVQLSDGEWDALAEEYQAEWQSIWNNKLDQLFSGQRFGAIIFNRRELPELEKVSLSFHPPTQVEIVQDANWIEIARAFWTGLDRDDPTRWRTFSQVFDWDADGIAKERRKQILQAADGKVASATNRDKGASDDHYVLKVLVVKWLAENLLDAGEEFARYDDISEIEDYRTIEKTIETEPSLSADENSIRPDVRDGPRVFEIEMFFDEGDGKGVVSKLQDTVRKYERADEIKTVNVVVDNLTCILHLKDIAQFKRNHQPWEQDYADINFYTVDLGEETLVSMDELITKLTELPSV
ncbi:hypothetical protein [Halocalculus aciditolerans]|uniref:Uncharacterized protein n=1 Tax=Halocalculus aciditolerans TaxID=1383812 RepID=A0A830FDL4_9EURY|nr:hypothetical protein [Halocalculus aciditolerans]GGL64325.1 hypothetical protein GCM10009039_22740 [Halocalculus aciditolerans]